MIESIYLLIVSGVANMAPPLAAKLWPRWNFPVDAGCTYKGKRILGDHKTIRGLVSGVIAGQLCYLIIISFFSISTDWYWGGVASVAGLSGDMVKSFFKRQIGIKSGRSWFPWDQIDWIIGTLPVIWIAVEFNLALSLTLVGAGLLLHLLVKAIGYLMKVNQTAI